MNILFFLLITQFSIAGFYYKPWVKNQDNTDVIFQMENKILRNCPNSQYLNLVGEDYKPKQLTYSIQLNSGVFYYNALIVALDPQNQLVVFTDQLSLCRR